MTTPLLHTIPSAVALSGVSRSGLYEQRKAGRLQFVKLGRRTYIANEELERFVEQLVTDSEKQDPGEAVARVVATAPRLSAEQLDRIAALLLPAGGGR